MQGCSSFPVRSVDCGTVIDKEPKQAQEIPHVRPVVRDTRRPAQAPTLSDDVEWSLADAPPRIDRRPVRQQNPGHIKTTMIGCDMKWSVAVTVLFIDPRSMIEKTLYPFHRICSGCAVERKGVCIMVQMERGFGGRVS